MNTNHYADYYEANRQGWNKRTIVHKDSSFYNLPAFKAGNSSLNAPELEELGDVNGKSILHLQCHFGMDTLSLGRLGAKVTGMDLSDNAISLAKELSAETGIPATFVCCNLYDLPQNLQGQFDIVFTSYGVVGWLPQLDKWAEIIYHFLKPGGTFHMIEFHPVVWMMDESFDHIKYFYHNEELIHEKQTGTYTDRSAAIEYEEYSWNHSLSEVVNSLIRQGLHLQHLNEFSFSCYNCFSNMVQGNDGYWRVKCLEDKMPMMYSVKAVKQES